MPVQAGNTALGEFSKITCNGALMRVVSGEVSMQPEKIQVGGNHSRGFTEKARGARTCAVSVEMVYRRTDNPMTNPPDFYDGEMDGPEVYIWPDFLNAPADFIHLPVTYIDGVTISIEGQGVSRFRCSFENQGPFWIPSRLEAAVTPDPG